jgi:hypothetical protein
MDDSNFSNLAKSSQTLFSENRGFKVLPPPYSPDLALCHFHLFGTLQHHLRNRRFEAEDDLHDTISGLSEAISLH